MKNKYFILTFILLIVMTLSLSHIDKYIFNTPDMIRNFSSKLGCSLKYVSKFSNEQVTQDIYAYSWIFQLADMTFSDKDKTVNSSFLGETTSYVYIPPFGCVRNNHKIKALFSKKMDKKFSNIKTNERHKISGGFLESIGKNDNEQGYDTRALVVMKNNKVVDEWYAESFNGETQFLGWSLSKTYFSLIVGAAIKQGLISEDESGLFSEWHDERKNIQYKHLLNMTTGLEFDERYSPGADATKMLFSDSSITTRAKAKKLSNSIGEFWMYSSGSTNLASEVLFNKFNRDLDEFYQFINEEVNQPSSISDAVLEHDVNGVYIASSFTYMTAKNWAMLGNALLETNESDLNATVTSEYLNDQLTHLNESKNEPRYGYQVWLNSVKESTQYRYSRLPASAFYAKGNKGQYILVDPTLNLVIVRLGWSDEVYPLERVYNDVVKYFNEES